MTDNKRPDIPAILARTEKATKGPWKRGRTSYNNDPTFAMKAPLVWPGSYGAPICNFDRPGAPEKDWADMEFIVSAREDVPALVTWSKYLEEQLFKLYRAGHIDDVRYHAIVGTDTSTPIKE